MKVLRQLRLLFLTMLALLACEHASAQLFGVSVSSAPSSIFVDEPLTYTINITNLNATGDVVVTDFLPPSVQYVSANSTFAAATISSSPGQVVFDLGFGFLPPNFATLTVNVVPTNDTLLTNVVTVGIRGVTNSLVVSNFTFVIVPVASLGVAITGPSAAVLANDWMTYSVTVTNTGSNPANNVVLGNVLPAGVGLVRVGPPSPPFTLDSNVMVFSLGDLPVGAAQTLFFTVQPTNAAVYPFIASVDADHATNVTVTNDIAVLPFDTNELVAANLSGMTYDPQNGLMEQTIQLLNTSASPVASARVVVSGLTNVLFNAVGTNNGNPFVQYNTNLNAGASVNLLMQYFVPTRQPIVVPNSAYAAVPVPFVNPPVPAGASVPVTLMTALSNGRVLIEFQSILGRTYTVLYSDNPGMTNAVVVQPNVVAPADRTQWIDYGPPETVSVPISVGSRFYTILLNP